MRRGMQPAAVLAITAFLAAAQSDEVRVSARTYMPPALHLSVQAQLVQLEVVVRDAHGQPVSGLKQSDFEILDDGAARDIAAFSVESRMGAVASASPSPAPASTPPGQATSAPPVVTPRFTMLFFDDLHGSQPEIQRTVLAAKQFVQSGLGLGGRAAVFTTTQGLTLDFTADSAALIAAIEKVHSRQRMSEDGLMPCPRITPYQAFRITVMQDADALNAAVQEAQQCLHADSSNATTKGRPLNLSRSQNPNVIAVQAQASTTWEKAHEDIMQSFDAVNKALGELAPAPGTRVLLLVSTGFLTDTMDDQKSAMVDRAVRAGIVINGLDAKGLWSESPTRAAGTVGSLPLATFLFEESSNGVRLAANNAVMQEFASGTGGLFFHNSNDLVGGFSQLAAVPETTYLIAIRPAEGAAGKYHKLNVRLTAKSSDYVQTRPGYFVPAGAPAAAAAPVVRPLDEQVTRSDVLSQIPVQVTAKPGKAATGETTVSLLIHVDLAPLKFGQRDDRHLQKLAFVGALLDSTGKMIAAKEGAMDFALKDDTLKRLTASGVNAGLTLAAAPGSYHVRVVVQDADGKLATINQSVEVPN
jgi:VWFA-related protein